MNTRQLTDAQGSHGHRRALARGPGAGTGQGQTLNFLT